MYRIRGSDQKEYGPIPLEQVRQWISENRLNRYSLASSDSNPGWRPLGQFPEFQDLLALQPVAIANAQSTPQAPPTAVPTAPAIPPPAVPPDSSIPISNIGAALPTTPAEQQVLGPAIALMILGGVGILYCLQAMLRMFITDWSQAVVPPETPPELQNIMKQVFQFLAVYGKTIGAGYYAVIAALHGLVLFGGYKMKQLESITVCWIATILTIPIYGCCCCLSLPFSIWAMVTLSRPEVRARFR